MPIGISAHLGLTHINPGHYAGSAGRLSGPRYDVKSMMDIASFHGFDALSPAAPSEKTTSRLFYEIFERAAQQLQAGDLFFFSYSGHGGLLPNLNANAQDMEDYDLLYY